MINALPRRDVRALSIGLTCVVGIFFCSRFIPWWSRTFQEERDAAREARSQLLAATALVQGMWLARDSVRAFAERLLTWEERLLSAETVAAADAELALLLTGAAAEAGVLLDVVQPLGDSLRFGPYVRVAVRTQLTGDVKGVMELLRLIETDTILVAVKSLSITQADPLADNSRAETLRGDIVLQALFQPSSIR